MITRYFNNNPVLKAMLYQGDKLSIEFKKGQIRVYNQVPAKIAYSLFYTTTATKSLEYYSNEIKGKFEVITVKNL